MCIRKKKNLFLTPIFPRDNIPKALSVAAVAHQPKWATVGKVPAPNTKCVPSDLSGGSWQLLLSNPTVPLGHQGWQNPLGKEESHRKAPLRCPWNWELLNWELKVQILGRGRLQPLLTP